VLLRVVVVASLIVGLMVALKDGRLLRTTGLTGTCHVIQTVSDGSEIASCSPGKLEGAPDLSHRGCRQAGPNGSAQFWRCPVGFDISDLSR
jgi:hypothetical protein